MEAEAAVEAAVADLDYTRNPNQNKSFQAGKSECSDSTYHQYSPAQQDTAQQDGKHHQDQPHRCTEAAQAEGTAEVQAEAATAYHRHQAAAQEAEDRAEEAMEAAAPGEAEAVANHLPHPHHH